MAGFNQRDVDLENQQGIPLQTQQEIANPDLHWIAIFNRYDHDGDGRISVHELKGIINSPEYRRGDIPDATIHAIMRLSDRNNDGFLCVDEFVEMIHHPAHQHIFAKMFQRYVKIIVPGRQHHDVTGMYTDGIYEEQYSCWPLPICMVIVSIIEFSLYLTDAIVNHPKGTGPIATVLIYNPYKRFEAWRFISYMFVHIGSLHLVINLVVQLLLGIPLEMVHKWWRVLLVYLAGVVAGSLGTSITDPSVFLAGASGGVYALITAHLATIFMNWSEIEFAVIQLLIFLCIIFTDVGTAIYNRYHLNLDESIGYVAHFAGAIAGLLVGIGVLRNLEVRSWEKKLWWAAVSLYCLLMSAAILMNIFWKDHFPSSRPDYK